jgi:hypothetical protein
VNNEVRSGSSVQLPIGTRIRFTHAVTSPANEDHPDLCYARTGETGAVTGYSKHWDYLVRTDSHASSFGVNRDEFMVIT